jgi:hypothetical protein
MGLFANLQRSFANALFPSQFVAWIDAVSDFLDTFVSTGEVIDVPTVVGAAPSLLTTVPLVRQGAIVNGYHTQGDDGGGEFYYDPSNNNVTNPDNGGTVIVPTARIGLTGAWIRVFSGPLQLKWFGAKCDDVTDDTAAIRLWIAAPGDTTKLRAATWQFPNGGTSVISGTIVIDRKSGNFQGPGAGSSTGNGFALRWAGVAAIPMVQITRCKGLRIGGLRLIGNTATPPSEAINFFEILGAEPNTDNLLEQIWVGGMSGNDVAVPNGFTKGITTTGANAQDDQSAMRDITVQDVIDACVEFSNTQNAQWHIDHAVFNAATCGVRSGTRVVRVTNANFSSLTNLIELTNDGSLWLDCFQAEGNSRLLFSTSGQFFAARNGYFQSNAALIPGNDAIVDVNTGGFSFSLKDVQFARNGVFAPGQEKFKIVSTSLNVDISNDTTFPDFPGTATSAHFQFSGQAPGQPINLWWGENYFNHWLDGAATTVGPRNDFVGNARLLLDLFLQGIDSAGVTRNLIGLRSADNSVLLGYAAGGGIIAQNDLRGGAGLDLALWRNLNLNQAASTINFSLAAHTYPIQIGGVPMIEVDDTIGVGETAFLVRRNVAGVFTVQRVKWATAPPGGSQILYMDP